MMDEDLNCDAPKEDHLPLFTWSNCYAQGERGCRIYRFGLLPNATHDVRVYVRHASWPRGNWKYIDFDAEMSAALVADLKGVRIPLAYETGPWSSIHNNNKLRVYHKPASVEIWWDSYGNAVTDALDPLVKYLNKAREDTWHLFDKGELRVDDAEL